MPFLIILPQEGIWKFQMVSRGPGSRLHGKDDFCASINIEGSKPNLLYWPVFLRSVVPSLFLRFAFSRGSAGSLSTYPLAV